MTMTTTFNARIKNMVFFFNGCRCSFINFVAQKPFKNSKHVTCIYCLSVWLSVLGFIATIITALN